MRQMTKRFLIAAALTLAPAPGLAALVVGNADELELGRTDPVMVQAYCGPDCREWHYQHRTGDHHRHHGRGLDPGRLSK